MSGANTHLGLPAGPLLFAGVMSLVALWVFGRSAEGWGGEHQVITKAAVESLPAQERDYLSPEQPALVERYCGFPDSNWPCYGEWGAGVGDPTAARFPDTRREWEISFYCMWDPVLRKGKGYPHGPPESCEAARVFFLKSAEAFRDGSLEDGARFLGVALHYMQDSGAMPQVQPIHRTFHVKNPASIRVVGYAPQTLGQTPEEAAKQLEERVQGLVAFAERRCAPLFEGSAISLEEAKKRCAKDEMPRSVVEAVADLRAKKAADFEAAARDCANECARVCADAIHTALAFAKRPRPEPAPSPIGVNLVFNPSFEKSVGDVVPEGWCVGWLDLKDRIGRAEWYLRRTHWEGHVKSGNRSLLLLWSPKMGLEWRPTWRRAIRVNPGEKYRASAWVETRAATGWNGLILEFYDTAYHPIARVPSESPKADQPWREISAEAVAPEAARWLRLLLHSESPDGAVWFDDVGLWRLTAK